MKADDLKKGLKSEEEVLVILKTVFGNNLERTAKYDLFDYFDKANNSFIELKTRNIKHNTYLDIMCGLNKLNFAKNNDTLKFYFCFRFIDGLYIHKFNKEKKYDVRTGGRLDRGCDESKLTFFINQKDLIPFDDFII
jgi:hypothetical protein